jgi:hypothetical protein
LPVEEEIERGTQRKYSNNLLNHIADDAVCLSGTSIVAGLSIPENLQSAEGPHHQ